MTMKSVTASPRQQHTISFFSVVFVVVVPMILFLLWLNVRKFPKDRHLR